ncbi:MAG: hypothetical protein PHS46_08040 [Candidatus Omnitrophica bacterium]|nr:hypothetical protein [Candidatus Omnitrophota bacterium]
MKEIDISTFKRVFAGMLLQVDKGIPYIANTDGEQNVVSYLNYLTKIRRDSAGVISFHDNDIPERSFKIVVTASHNPISYYLRDGWRLERKEEEGN